MTFSSGKKKIGMAGNPYNRYGRLVEDTPFKEALKSIYYVPFLDRLTARKVEKTLHKEFESFNVKVLGDVVFEGYTEFFGETLDVNTVIGSLESHREYRTCGYINPFLTLKKLPRGLKEELYTYIRATGVYKSNMYGELEARVKCIVANIVLQDKRSYHIPSGVNNIRGIVGLVRKLQEEDYLRLSEICSKYDLTLTYNKGGYRKSMDKAIKDLYLNRFCGLPFIDSLLHTSKDAPFYQEFLSGYNRTVNQTEVSCQS